MVRYGSPSREARALVASLIAVLFALAPTPANATFHIAHIERLMTGLDGSTDVQFVEMVMDATGQNFVAGAKLSAFAADGSFAHVVTTLGSNVQSGSGRPYVMASSAFAAAAGITADFTFDSSAGKGLEPTDGMVCWGKPADQTKPDQYIDCVSYGNYTGPANSHTSAPSATTPFGHGLVRVSKTGSSANDFTCEDPAEPANNANQVGSIAASSSCAAAECGDGEVQPPETCDDGDTTFHSGDFCSADCTVVPCGQPTDPGSASPKTTDALFVLRVAVGVGSCDVRVCDVNGSNTITTGDALSLLKKAVGQNITLACPS